MSGESRKRIQFSVPVRQGPQSWVHVEHIYFGSGLQYIDQSSLNTGEEKNKNTINFIQQ